MSLIELNEHKSSSYAPRTYHNAAQGVTLAIAIDFNTAGEKLTHKASNGKIVQAHYDDDWKDTARKLYTKLKKENCHVVNVAGNGIYTLQKYSITQDDINLHIYKILNIVNQHWKIDKVVSGGQTGADIAGLVAAYTIGIEAEGTWPKGYKMRWEDGKDVDMDLDFIKTYIEVSSDVLSQRLQKQMEE